MKLLKHLTEKELLSYAKGSLNEEESQEFGKHLLQCDDCRKVLPVPTPQRFSAILTDDKTEIDDIQTDKTFFSSLTNLSYLSVFVRQPQTLAWVSGTIIIVLSFSFLLWFNSHQGEREVAASFELKNDEINFKPNTENKKEIKQITTDSASNKRNSLSELNEKISDTNQIHQKKKPNEQMVNQTPLPKIEQKSIKKELKKADRNISTTRGGIADCNEEKNINVEFKPIERTVVFKWKEVPNAKKYYLYISDDKEILIDEFETDKATSYVLNIPLDAEKTYKWKILIILENGETIMGKSEKFTMNDFQTDQKEIKRKNKSQIRCSPKS